MMRKVHFTAATLLITMVLCASTIGAKTYYVSTKGADTADGGSEKTAWRTIAHAAKVAQAGDTVLVAPGDYGDERVVFANSGKKGKPIVVKGHPGSVAVANGGRPTLKSTSGKTKAFLIKGKSYIRIEGFDIFGYGSAVYIHKGSSCCHLQNLRCFGRGGAISMLDDVHHCLVDGCYVEDAYRNAIMIYSDPGPKGRWKRRPCTFNTISNSVVVRGGHSSFDVHTCCPDTYVVGCLTREKGKERDGRTAACGFYLHNFGVDRMRIIGNAVTKCYWGIALTGASDCLMAENLVFGNSRGITLDRSDRWDKPGKPAVPCEKNVIADNIIFDVGKPWAAGVTLAGATNNIMARNYTDKPNMSYEFHRYREADSNGNSIVDPIGGRFGVSIKKGTSVLRINAGFAPTGTVYRLRDGKTLEKILDGEGVSFGTLLSEIYTGTAVATAPSGATTRYAVTIRPTATYFLSAIAPGDAPAPMHLRAAPLPEVAGGAAIVWADLSDKETGFAVERKLSNEKDFKQISKLKTDTTRYMDKEVGRKKAIYRVRAIYGDKKSKYSNTDELVRYGYWFTNRTGLAVDGYTAFGQVERGDLKTLIVEKAKRVERKADAAEGVSALALLEAGKPGAAWPESAGAKGKAEVWLVASKPVTMTLRWRAGWIRGFVEGESEYSLELTTAGRAVKSATFNGKTVKTVYNKDKGLVRLDLSGNGALAVELINE